MDPRPRKGRLELRRREHPSAPASRKNSRRSAAAAICAPQNMDKVETAFKEELARVVRDGFTAAEFEGARKELLDRSRPCRSSDRNLMTSILGNRPATAGPCSAPSTAKPASPR